MIVKLLKEKFKSLPDGQLWISNSPVTDFAYDWRKRTVYLLSDFDSDVLLKSSVLKELNHTWENAEVILADTDFNQLSSVKNVFVEDNDWKLHYS